jgi:hypothetical protein
VAGRAVADRFEDRAGLAIWVAARLVVERGEDGFRGALQFAAGLDALADARGGCEAAEAGVEVGRELLVLTIGQVTSEVGPVPIAL